MEKRKKGRQSLVQIGDSLLTLKNSTEADAFLGAILSSAEYERLQKRWYAYQLRAGGMTLAEIVQIAHVAMATATRAAALHRTHREILDVVMARGAGGDQTNNP